MIDLNRPGGRRAPASRPLKRPKLGSLTLALALSTAAAALTPAPDARAHEPTDIAVQLTTLTRDAVDAPDLIGLPVQVSVTCGNRMRSMLHGTLDTYEKGTGTDEERRKHTQLVWLPAGCADIVLHGKILRRPHSDGFIHRMIENVGRNDYLTDGNLGVNPDWWEIFDTKVLFHKCQQDAIEKPQPGSKKTYAVTVSLKQQDGYFCTLKAE